MSFSFDSVTAFNRTVLQIPKDEYPNVDKATAVIIDMGDSVSVGVKMVMFVTRNFEGKETVEAEQFGDYCKVSKDAKVADIFDALKRMANSCVELAKQEEGKQPY